MLQAEAVGEVRCPIFGHTHGTGSTVRSPTGGPPRHRRAEESGLPESRDPRREAWPGWPASRTCLPSWEADRRDLEGSERTTGTRVVAGDRGCACAESRARHEDGERRHLEIHETCEMQSRPAAALADLQGGNDGPAALSWRVFWVMRAALMSATAPRTWATCPSPRLHG